MVAVIKVASLFEKTFRVRGERHARERYISPRGLIRVIVDSLHLYKKQWLAIAGIYVIPAFALSAMNWWFLHNEETWEIWPLLYLKLTVLLLGPLTVATSEACLGHPPSLTRAYKRLGGRVFPLWVMAVLFQILLINSGLLGLQLTSDWQIWASFRGMVFVRWLAAAITLLPILVFGAWYMFVQQAIILDHCGVIGAFKRSRFLGRGYYVRNLLYFLSISISLILIARLTGLLLVEVKPNLPHGGWTEFWEIIVGSAPGILVTPIFGISLVLLYYDLRVRKEGYDLEQLEQELRR